MSLLPLQNTLPQGVHGLAPTSLCSGVTAGRCLPSPPCPAHPACLSCPHTCCLAPHYHLMYKLINIFTILQFIIHPPPHKKASPKAARWCPLPRTVLAQWASNNALLGHSRGCNGPCILGNELLFTLRSPGGGGGQGGGCCIHKGHVHNWPGNSAGVPQSHPRPNSHTALQSLQHTQLLRNPFASGLPPKPTHDPYHHLSALSLQKTCRERGTGWKKHPSNRKPAPSPPDCCQGTGRGGRRRGADVPAEGAPVAVGF